MAKKALSMKLTGGNFRHGPTLQQHAGPLLAPPIQQGAAQFRDHLKRATPQVSGHLAGGWTAPPAPSWDRSGAKQQYVSSITNLVPYLRRVNATSKKNAGFLERALKTAAPDVRRLLRLGVLRISKAVWEPEGKHQ